jgi:hypothetical protein
MRHGSNCLLMRGRRRLSSTPTNFRLLTALPTPLGD